MSLESLGRNQPLPNGTKGKGCCSGTSPGVGEKAHQLRGLGRGDYHEAGEGPGGQWCPLEQGLGQEGPEMVGDLLVQSYLSLEDCLDGG